MHLSNIFSNFFFPSCFLFLSFCPFFFFISSFLSFLRHIKYFWTALETMSKEELSHLINFCSGRSRLPPSASDSPMAFRLTAPPPRSKDTPDSYLPIAQTCFFSLSLPEYSNLEVCDVFNMFLFLYIYFLFAFILQLLSLFYNIPI